MDGFSFLREYLKSPASKSVLVKITSKTQTKIPKSITERKQPVNKIRTFTAYINFQAQPEKFTDDNTYLLQLPAWAASFSGKKGKLIAGSKVQIADSSMFPFFTHPELKKTYLSILPDEIIKEEYVYPDNSPAESQIHKYLPTKKQPVNDYPVYCYLGLDSIINVEVVK